MVGRRSMTNEEIALAKAMLLTGLRNDQIHFFFNRPDRLLSSGRIAQIKKGSYGSDVGAATPVQLEAFLASHGTRVHIKTISPINDNVLRAMFNTDGENFTLRTTETDQIECKLSFRLSPDDRFSDVLRAIAGLANNRGGYIFFGIQDATWDAVGLQNAYFEETDLSAINRTLISSLDPAPMISKTTLVVNSKKIGVIHVEKHNDAPLVSIKNVGTNFKEGMIYYRYPGETRSIKPGELRRIIQMREQRAVSDFAKRVGGVATGRNAVLDLETGEASGPHGSFVIDQKLLPTLQFIREGDFSERKGSPTLRLVGEVRPIAVNDRRSRETILENITSHQIVTAYLRGEVVANPLLYITAQAHMQRKWMPVWHFLRLARMPSDQAVASLDATVCTNISNRNSLISRINLGRGAWKAPVGTPKRVAQAIQSGEIPEPNGGATDSNFALAVAGLPSGSYDINRLKRILLECLERAEMGGGGPQRSNVYRAACRLDEIEHEALQVTEATHPSVVSGAASTSRSSGEFDGAASEAV